MNESLTPEEAYQAFEHNYFKPLPQNAKSLGFFDETIWIALEIQNGCAQELFLSLSNLSLDNVEYFIYHKGKMLHRGVTGAMVPIQERYIQTLDLRLPLVEINEPVVYLMKIHTHNSMIVPIVLGTDGALQLFTLPEIVAIGIFTGVFLALFLYNCILFIATKQRDYLLYSLYIFSLFCFILSLREYFLLLLQDHLYLRNPLKLISLQAATLFFIFFTLNFLNIKALSKRLYRDTLYGTTLIFLLLASMSFGALGHYLGMLAILLTIIMSLFLGIFAKVHHNHIAKYYLLAVGCFFIGSSITIGMVLGVLAYSFSTSMPLLIGSMLEMLLFSLALGYKIRSLSLEHTKTLTQLQAQNKILFLQSRYTSVGELIRNITHQWKEPLGEIGAIQTNLKSTLVFQGSVSNEKLLNAINLSHKIISHLAETIDTFYRFFRAKTTENQEFDITREIDNLKKMVNYTFDSEQIVLTCTYSEHPINIYGHPNEFAHAILNIILNAKDMLIKRQIKNPMVSIDVSTTQTEILIHISDNGGGISQVPITKIFNAGVSSKEENIGIGLYIAKTIIEKKMQGRLLVKNSDVGAVFTLKLPHVFTQTSTPPEMLMEMEESSIVRISQLEKDIARRIEVEKNLQQWAQIFEKAHWGIAICSATHNTFDLINPEFARMHGFSVEELLNQPIANIFEPNHRAHIPEALQKVHEEGHYAFESEHLRKDGSTFPVDIDIIAVKSESGELLYRIANVRDITLYKQTHERLLLKKFALNHIQDAVFLIDENADFCDVNEGACKALGYAHHELMNMNVGDIDPEWPKERWPEHWNELKKAGSMTMELRHKRKDGSIFPVEISANYIEFAGKTYNMSIVRDITERKAAQTELLLINKALNNTDEATYIFLFDKITQVNDGACKMLGYSREELTSMSLYDIDPTLTKEELERIGTLGDGTNSLRFERRHRTKDGNILDVEIVTNMFEHDGTTYAFAAVRDITEQKKATETLHLQKFALDTINEAVYLIDENSMFHYINEGACRALGYTKEALLKLGVVHIDPNCTPEWWKAHWADIKKQKNMLIEATHQRKDGTLIPIEVSINYFEYNGVGYNLAVTRDISERLLLEERKEDERMRLFFEKQLVGMAISSPEKSWLKVNDKLCTMFGYSQEELTHKTWSELTYPEDLEPDVTQFERVLRGEIEGFSIQKRFIHKDGSLLYTNLSTTCIRNTDGTASYFLTLIEDITEQTHAHEALMQKEQELRSLAESSPGMMGSFCLRPDGSMYLPYVSPNIIDIFGLHPEEVQNDATALLTLNHPDDAQRIYESILTSAEEMSVWHEEYRIIHPLKGERWMESSTKPERNANGEITWYGYVHDITERKKVEEKLQENQAHLLAIISTIPDKIWLKDKDGIYLMCNSAYERFLGAPKENIIGKTDYDFVTKEQGDFFRQKDAEAMAAGTICINEEEVFQNNGQYAFLETRKVPVYNNQTLVGILGIGRDITKRKQMEKEIENSYHFLNQIVDAIPDPIFVKDREHRWLLLNNANIALTGIAREMLLGKSDYDIFSKEEADIFWAKDEAVFSSGKVNINEEYFTSSDGTTHCIETVKSMFVSTDGNEYLVGTIRDISERKQAEETIKELNTTLEEKVKKRTLQLQEALEFSNGVINALPDLLFEIDLHGTYLNVWARDEELLATHKEHLLGHNVYDVLSPESANTVIEALKEANTIGVSFGKTIKIELPQGAMYFEESVSKKNSSNTFLVLSHDITERKKAELDLQEKEEKFSKLFKLSPAAISITSLERNMYLDVNDSFLYHTGYAYEEVVGKSSADLGLFVNPEERAEFFKRVIEDGYIKDFNYSFRAKDGRIGYAMAYASLITFKGERCLIGHSYDMSERKKIEILQHERLLLEERLSKIATAAPGVNYIFEKTVNGTMRFTYLSSGFTELFGISREDALADFSTTLEHIHSDDKESIRQSLPLNEKTLGKWHEEFRITHPEKGTLWIEGQSKPELQTDGSILWYGFFHDVTERKKAENALAKSEEAFRAIVENSPDVIARYDLDCKRIYVNPMMQRLIGKPLEEILGKTPREYSPLPQSAEFEKLFYQVVKEGQEITFESPYVTSTGEERFGMQRIIPEFDKEGNIISILVIGRDLTVWKMTKNN